MVLVVRLAVDVVGCWRQMAQAAADWLAAGLRTGQSDTAAAEPEPRDLSPGAARFAVRWAGDSGEGVSAEVRDVLSGLVDNLRLRMDPLFAHAAPASQARMI